MYAAIRRYEGVDEDSRDRITSAVKEDFLPRLREAEGLQAYYIVDAGGGVLASVTISYCQQDPGDRRICCLERSYDYAIFLIRSWSHFRG